MQAVSSLQNGCTAPPLNWQGVIFNIFTFAVFPASTASIVFFCWLVQKTKTMQNCIWASSQSQSHIGTAWLVLPAIPKTVFRDFRELMKQKDESYWKRVWPPPFWMLDPGLGIQGICWELWISVDPGRFKGPFRAEEADSWGEVQRLRVAPKGLWDSYIFLTQFTLDMGLKKEHTLILSYAFIVLPHRFCTACFFGLRTSDILLCSAASSVVFTMFAIDSLVVHRPATFLILCASRGIIFLSDDLRCFSAVLEWVWMLVRLFGVVIREWFLFAMGAVIACIIGCAAGCMRVSTLSILVKLCDCFVVFGHVV